MADPLSIPLAWRVPFVAAVLQILEGRGTYASAVSILIEAEDRHGIRIIHDENGSLALALIPSRDTYRPTMRQILDLNHDLDRLWEQYREAPRELADAAERTQLLPFISETWFLLGGVDFANDHLIEYSSGMLCSWTQRAWGSLLAEWANATEWMPHQRSLWHGDSWEYATFTSYLYKMIDRYDEWAGAVLRILQLKCTLQLAREAGEDEGRLE